MQSLLTRLGRLETTIVVKPPTAACRFVIQGPHELATDEAATFLRGQGHSLDGGALNIIRRVIGVEDGRPVDLPLADLTARRVE